LFRLPANGKTVTMTDMRRRRGFVIVFFIFLLLSIIFFLLFGRNSEKAPSGVIEIVVSPIQRFLVGSTTAVGNLTRDQEIEALRKENQQLRAKDAESKKLEREMAALRDQFKETNIPTQKLSPAQIIGRRGFVPGVSVPDTLIINRGKAEGIRRGQVVVYENVVLGQVAKVSTHLSEVILLWNPVSSLTVMTSQNANGILKGKGKGELVLDNVVLSEKLQKGDSVVTKGDVNSEGLGYPPDLLVGKILSVEKKQSALFQTAEVVSPVDVSRITTVFVLNEAL
jgi:rod shape-determining protein MreC